MYLFKKGTSLKGKNMLTEGANSFLYEQFLIVWKLLLPHKVTPPLSFTIFIMHVRNCVIGVTPKCAFLGTDVSPFPNFNNSVLTTRRNLLLHC